MRAPDLSRRTFFTVASSVVLSLSAQEMTTRRPPPTGMSLHGPTRTAAPRTLMSVIRPPSSLPAGETTVAGRSQWNRGARRIDFRSREKTAIID